MFLSARKTFRRGDRNWDAYINWMGLPDLQEIRSLDNRINSYVDGTRSLDCLFGDVRGHIGKLPKVSGDSAYYQVAIDLSYEALPEWPTGNRFLGCDLADDAWRSSVLNYGPWTGELEPLAKHLSEFGLLKLADAQRARSVIARQWNRANAYVDLHIWALYELAPEGERRDQAV